MSHRFCTELSRLQGDPLAGSAAHIERNLLLSWPRAKWKRNLRHASDMPEALTEQLDAIAASGRRINLIQRRDYPEGLHRIYLMPERLAFDVQRDELQDFLSAWQRGASLDAWQPSAVTRDLVLCCTHGKKDKCCAKFGYAAFQALDRAVREHQLPFDVWESSHLGGCRLAASMILLSPVRKYGRIAPDQAYSLLASEADGQRYLPCYRGDSSLTPPQQCAQLAILNYVAAQAAQSQAPQSQPSQPRLTLEEELILGDEEGDDEQRQLIWHCRHGDGRTQRLKVSCRAISIMRVDTCNDLDEGPTPSLVWQAERVEVLVGQQLPA